MISTGQLLSTLSLRVVLGEVESATTVMSSLLMEDAEFLKFVGSADKLQDVIDWVDENY
jgi:hypothetical protein